MTKITLKNKKIAKKVASALGDKPTITRFWDDNHNSYVDILSNIDRPDKGVTSYGTIGLSDYPLILDKEEYPARVELVGACDSQYTYFSNILATSAFCVINSEWFCCPGTVFPDIVAMYDNSKTMRHIFFTSPFLWESELTPVVIDSNHITWLLLVPISESELIYSEKHGPTALEDLFVEKQIDIYDLNRPPVV